MLLAVRDEETKEAFLAKPCYHDRRGFGIGASHCADGTIYSDDYNMQQRRQAQRLNPDGSMKWAKPDAYDYTIRSSAVMGVDGTIFVGVDADTYKLVALDARTGSKKGEVRYSQNLQLCPAGHRV